MDSSTWGTQIITDLSVGAIDIRFILLGGLGIWLTIMGVRTIVSILRPSGNIGGNSDGN